MPTHTNKLLVFYGICLLVPIAGNTTDPPCARRTDLAGACFRVRGNLKLFNGTPSARITVRGSKRLLGVVPYIADNNETFAAPAEVRSHASFDTPLLGDYLVCPLSKPRPHEMQQVCIESATINTKSK